MKLKGKVHNTLSTSLHFQAFALSCVSLDWKYHTLHIQWFNLARFIWMVDWKEVEFPLYLFPGQACALTRTSRSPCFVYRKQMQSNFVSFSSSLLLLSKAEDRLSSSLYIIPSFLLRANSYRICLKARSAPFLLFTGLYYIMIFFPVSRSWKTSIGYIHSTEEIAVNGAFTTL